MYTFPSTAINFVTYTAKRWGQIPTITYIAGGTAGSETVTVAPDLSDITITIESGVSTNQQIVDAIYQAKNIAVESLYASDLVTAEIVPGHESNINITTGTTTMIGGSSVPPPIEPNIVLTPTGVIPGEYTNTDLTVDAAGRVQVAANGSTGSSYAADGATLQLVDSTFSVKSGGIDNSHINIAASIAESKLALDYSTDSLYTLASAALTSPLIADLDMANNVLYLGDSQRASLRVDMSTGIIRVSGNASGDADFGANRTLNIYANAANGYTPNIKLDANGPIGFESRFAGTDTSRYLALSFYAGKSAGFHPTTYFQGESYDFLGIGYDANGSILTGSRINANIELTLSAATNDAAKFDASVTAGDTRFLLWDVDKATLARVSVGAADSAGTGYKVLRIPN